MAQESLSRSHENISKLDVGNGRLHLVEVILDMIRWDLKQGKKVELLDIKNMSEGEYIYFKFKYASSKIRAAAEAMQELSNNVCQICGACGGHALVNSKPTGTLCLTHQAEAEKSTVNFVAEERITKKT